jgi:hypothetical protein
MKKIPKPKSLKKQCDELWAKVIKARAGYMSELSGKTEALHSHHIAGKDCYRLRWELDNGICLTAGEHFYGIHHQGRKSAYEERIKRVKGQDIFERMEKLRQYNAESKIDLMLTKIYLETELKRLENKK